MTERPAFEVGQIWRSRANGMFEIVPQLDYGLGGDDDPYPISARALDGSETITTTKYGRVYEDPEAIDDNDLIRLVSEAPGAAEKRLRDEAMRRSVEAHCRAKAEAEAKPAESPHNGLTVTNCVFQAPAVNLRLEALKLAVQFNDEIINTEYVVETAEIFLAFLDPPPPAEDLPVDLNDDSYELAGTKYDTDRLED
jgi:hypothetical protein